jgi:hypothetical protein
MHHNTPQNFQFIAKLLFQALNELFNDELLIFVLEFNVKKEVYFPLMIT